MDTEHHCEIFLPARPSATALYSTGRLLFVLPVDGRQRGERWIATNAQPVRYEMMNNYSYTSWTSGMPPVRQDDLTHLWSNQRYIAPTSNNKYCTWDNGEAENPSLMSIEFKGLSGEYSSRNSPKSFPWSTARTSEPAACSQTRCPLEEANGTNQTYRFVPRALAWYGTAASTLPPQLQLPHLGLSWT